jgi:hypothetical protein
VGGPLGSGARAGQVRARGSGGLPFADRERADESVRLRLPQVLAAGRIVTSVAIDTTPVDRHSR